MIRKRGNNKKIVRSGNKKRRRQERCYHRLWVVLTGIRKHRHSTFRNTGSDY